jgi:hypothetical protein
MCRQQPRQASLIGHELRSATQQLRQPIDATRARGLIEKAIADAVPITGWASEAQRSPYRW